MTVKFPFADKTNPGSVFIYDKENVDPNIKEAAITNLNLKEASSKILLFSDENDKFATKVRVNSSGLIIKAEDIKEGDIPPHRHINDDTGGLIRSSFKIFILELIENQSRYTIPEEVYKNIQFIIINGIYIHEFKTIEEFYLDLLFNIDQPCTALLLF